MSSFTASAQPSTSSSSSSPSAPPPPTTTPTPFPFPADVHLCTPTEISADRLVAIESFKQRIKANSKYFNQLEGWLTTNTLQRFLIARKFNEDNAYALIESALEWRCKRQPHLFEATEGWMSRMSLESETGKIYIPGYDNYGRPVIIFDNTVQNTTSVDENMQFLSWNLEFATKLMPSHADKYVVFMHLANFSIWNVPPMASVTETIHMLCNCYPERLGHMIAFLPPFYFNVFYKTIWYLLDEKTAAKVIFISGDVSEGSENDLKLKEVIGDHWRDLTGAEKPVLSPGCSPGYKHEEYWPTVAERIDALQQNSFAFTKFATPSGSSMASSASSKSGGGR